jgi:hypothetical protein
MDKQTKGAWVIYHSGKLQNVTRASVEYEQINLAGKCGVLLSSLAASEESILSREQVNGLAKAVEITKLELPSVLSELERQQLISATDAEVAVLGVSMASALGHVSTIFDESEPSATERAIIDLSEKTSELPCDSEWAKEYVGDTYKISDSEVDDLLSSTEQIGFIDFADLSGSRKILFNGHLFRREDARKIDGILSSMSDEDSRKIVELNTLLDAQGCISITMACHVASQEIFNKLHSIGVYDVNCVENSQGKFEFVTKASAFSKFTVADDAFDLAKIFVTSLTYGITYSSPGRGRISMIQRLMQKLIDGYWVGPATAIGQDYKLLELRRVVEVKSSKSDSMFSMRLLKKDVGKLALKLIMSGDVSTEAIELPSASVISYSGPEITRTIQRKRQTAQSQASISQILDGLRTGVI